MTTSPPPAPKVLPMRFSFPKEKAPATDRQGPTVTADDSGSFKP
jgi:hypothetical protein